MVTAFQTPLTGEDIKAKALDFGVDLVGIADGKVMDEYPPDPADPRRPCDITDHDGDRVIVLAKRLTSGTTRLTRWDERHKYYNDELTLTSLEEASLELVLWLESHGYPALAIPPTHVDPWRYGGDPGQHQKPILSFEHAAVEAGLGTLGLNLQLLTPEFGPRVMLTAVLCSIDVTPDEKHADSLCLGPACGRCLRACPGDVIGHWERDWNACDTYRSPHGFKHLTEFLGKLIEAPAAEQQKALLRSEDSFNLWQSILRGSGVVTGCRRCQDVCPVGADYAAHLEDVLDVIRETNDAKEARLTTMRQAESDAELPPAYARQRRWIGNLRRS